MWLKTEGKRAALLTAVDVLEREGYFTKDPPRSGGSYTSVKPYREANDPRSERGDIAQRLLEHRRAQAQEAGDSVGT